MGILTIVPPLDDEVRRAVQQSVVDGLDGPDAAFDLLADEVREWPDAPALREVRVAPDFARLIADPAGHMDKVFALLGLECPQLALDMFQHRVASTRENPAQEQLQILVRECLASSSNDEFLSLAATLGYG